MKPTKKLGEHANLKRANNIGPDINLGSVQLKMFGEEHLAQHLLLIGSSAQCFNQPQFPQQNKMDACVCELREFSLQASLVNLHRDPNQPDNCSFPAAHQEH